MPLSSPKKPPRLARNADTGGVNAATLVLGLQLSIFLSTRRKWRRRAVSLPALGYDYSYGAILYSVLRPDTTACPDMKLLYYYGARCAHVRPDSPARS